MPNERARETQSQRHSPEPSATGPVREDGLHRRAEKSGASSEKGARHEAPSHKPAGGRPHKRWKIQVVRIDAAKYPQYAQDKDHPFARMAVEARLEEIDTFLARLRARRRTPKPASGGMSAAA